MDTVECLSSSANPERPLALVWEGQRLEITNLLSRWQTPEALCFRVRTQDQRLFELVFHQDGDWWQIQPIPGG